MQTFYSTFTTGFADVVKKTIKEQLPSIKVKQLLDGLIIYQTDYSLSKINNIRFFNNSFLLLNQIKYPKNSRIEQIVKILFNKSQLENFNQIRLVTKSRTFRVIISKENQLISISPATITRFEKRLSRTFHLKPNRSNPDLEFWFLIRREGIGLFGLRITHTGRKKVYKRAKGELRKELAHLLCLISEPNKNDVFLDPFCGSGAIPLERIKSFPFKQVLMGDKNIKLVKKLKRKLRKYKRIKINYWDALSLETLSDSSIDKIVTDPPWGFYQAKKLNLGSFYTKMLSEFCRILKFDGLAVILIGERESFEKSLENYKNCFEFRQKYDTLVSGKKASVYKLRKRNR